MRSIVRSIIQLPLLNPAGGIASFMCHGIAMGTCVSFPWKLAVARISGSGGVRPRHHFDPIDPKCWKLRIIDLAGKRRVERNSVHKNEGALGAGNAAHIDGSNAPQRHVAIEGT